MLAALSLLATLLPTLRNPVNAQSNPIVTENAHPGTALWQLYLNGHPVADDINRQIQGYASAPSVSHGEVVTFHITVSPTQNYAVDIYRVGYYGGLGGRLIQHIGALSGAPQPDCPMDAHTGLRACDWTPSLTLTVPHSWTTGIYRAVLTNQLNFQSAIHFTVRDDTRIADFLYQQPVLTYQAYNNWPAGSGKSLYEFNSSGANTLTGFKRAAKVSFDRPTPGLFNTRDADFGFEFNLVYWLEQEGYDVSYSTDLDTHRNGWRLKLFDGFFAAGHSEYWTREMFDAAEHARDAGVNLAFWGANAVYWQVRLEPSGAGRPDRVLVGYKNAGIDPVTDPARKTITWRDTGRPEQTLIGVQYTTDNASIPTQPLHIGNTAHWAYTGSGLTAGMTLTRVVGFEVDRLFDTYAKPLSTTYAVLATSPFTASTGAPDVSQAALYQAPSGAWVFGSGTLAWSWGLSRPGIQHAGLQRVTRNILARFRQRPWPLTRAVFLPVSARP